MKTTTATLPTIINKNLFLIIITQEGNIIDANEEFNRVFFHSTTVNKDSNIYNLLHQSSKALFTTALQKTRLNNQPAKTCILLKNEVIHKQLWEIEQLLIHDIEYFICYGINVHENTITIQDVNNQQDELHKIKPGIIVHNTNHEIIVINRPACALLCATENHIKENKFYKTLWKSNFQESGNGTNYSKTISWLNGINDNRIFNFNLLRISENSEAFFNYYVSFFYPLKDKTIMHESEENLKIDPIITDFFNKSASMKWVVDEKETLVFANVSFLNFFRLNKGLLGKNIYEIFPKNLADLFHAGHSYVLENGDIQNHIQHSKQANGEEFFLQTNLHLLKNDSLKRYLGGEAINITESTKAKKELEKASERLDVLTKTTTDSIWEWNIKTGDIFRNETLHNLIGYKQVETSDLSWWYEQIHPDDRELVEQKISYALSHHEPHWEQEYRFRCNDGNYMQVFDRGSILYEYGVPTKMIGTIQDLSKIKALESSLYEEKIQNQKSIAETIISVQEKERTNLGHELHDNVNQILMTAKLYLGMLQLDEPDKKAIKDKAVGYIMESIEEIRILSKKLVIPQLKESGLITSIQPLIDDIEITTKLKFNFKYDEDVEVMLENKKVTFFRIIQEQFKNIIKYSQASHVEINIISNKTHFELQIRDNGVGFDTTKTRQGIGLSNIYERVKLYEGHVTINSSPGRGCELIVGIPKRKSLQDENKNE